MVLAESPLPLPPPSPSPSPPPPPPPPPSLKESAVPSFTLVLNLIPILMIITFSIYVSCKQNQDQTANIDDTETGTRSGQQQQQQQHQVVLEVFRTVFYDKIEEGIIEDLSCRNCAICLEDFQDGDENGIFTKCNHMYHKLCIDQWQRRNERRPLCRGPVRITQNK